MFKLRLVTILNLKSNKKAANLAAFLFSSSGLFMPNVGGKVLGFGRRWLDNFR